MKKLLLLQIFILAGMWCAVVFGQTCRVKTVAAPTTFTNSVVIAIPDTITDWCSSTTAVSVTFYVIENNDGHAVNIVKGNKLIDNHKVYKAKMHVRGDATAHQSKKQFAVDLDQDSAGNFLGMPNKGKNWVFNDCGTFDLTLMRNVITFEMQKGLGQYAPHYAWFELFLCQPSASISSMSNILANDYYGLYLNFDKIRFEKDRVTDVDKNKAPKKKDLENGHYALLQINQLEPSKYKELTWNSSPSASCEVYEPKAKDYAKSSYAGAFEKVDNWYTDWATPSATIYTNNFVTKPRDTTGNAANIASIANATDCTSFVTYFLINELSKDQDGYHKSTFMVKKKDKCYAGPLWDKNKSYGNTWIAPPTLDTNTNKMDSLWNITPRGWLFADFNTNNEDGNQSSQWWSAFLVDSNYCNAVWETWQTEKDNNNYLDTNYLNKLIDKQILFINNTNNTGKAANSALQRNNTCWQNTGIMTIDDYNMQVAQLKKYLSERWTWMDANLESLLTYYCPNWKKP